MKVNWIAAALVLGAAPALAQQAPAGPRPESSKSWTAENHATSQARFQMRIMESVLENAVQQGAQVLDSQLRKLSPGVTLFSGPPRARGFQLGEYGFFFAVDVPALHRSVTWSVRTLAQANGDVSRALQLIRRMVQGQNDPGLRKDLEQALRLVELQVGPSMPRGGLGADRVTAATVSGPQTGVGVAAADPAPPDLPAAIVADPDEAYTTAVQGAIVEAMIDYGTTLPLESDQWLTIAARENRDSVLAGDLTETVTITLRVKGSDLGSFRSGLIPREDLRRRVEVREF